MTLSPFVQCVIDAIYEGEYKRSPQEAANAYHTSGYSLKCQKGHWALYCVPDHWPFKPIISLHQDLGITYTRIAHLTKKEKKALYKAWKYAKESLEELHIQDAITLKDITF